MTQTTDALFAGREAAERLAWSEALALLIEADAANPLGPDDLDTLASAAWWTGRMQDCIAARERAHAAYLENGDRRRAALVAVRLAEHHADLLEMPVAGAWLQRAGKLLENEPDCVERGHLNLITAMASRAEGRIDDALTLAVEALEIATRFGDRDLMALALAAQGSILVGKGEVDRGMTLLDEATVAAVSGELGPFATGIVYCMMISNCAAVADWERAGQWTEAATRWCNRQAISGFPGVCRVHRAEIMRLRGSFSDAEEEARVATTELGQFNLMVAGWAFYELGEIRLRVGDLDAAEEAFGQAHELGRTPQPGLALVQLRRGNVKAAVNSIRRALAEEGVPALERAKLLPAQVEIALANRDVETARTAAEELAVIARSYTTPAMQAAVESSNASVALASGDLRAAESAAKRAVRLWKQADLPYEVARVCSVLGEIYAADGDRDAAELELRAARSGFEKLGATPDAYAVADRLAALSAATAPVGRRVSKTFMFSDIVKSTNLLEAIGDEAWTDLLTWHDETLRALFRAHGGEEVVHTGDGFFVAFETPDAAVSCAIAIQRSLADHRRTHGFAPQVRIGVHATDAAEVGGNYHGKGVHEAARIGALAEGGEIVVSAATVECLETRPTLSDIRAVSLKGVSEPVEIASVVWRAS